MAKNPNKLFARHAFYPRLAPGSRHMTPISPPSRRRRTFILATCSGILVPLLICLGIIAIDTAHLKRVQAELQAAVEAAALAGAANLGSSSPADTEARMLAILGAQNINGQPLNGSPADVATAMTVTPLSASQAGRVSVRAAVHVDLPIPNPIMPQKDSVEAAALAAGGETIAHLFQNQAFPLAISLDAAPRGAHGRDLPLYQHRPGEAMMLHLTSDEGRNAAFTTFGEPPTDSEYLGQAMRQQLKLVSQRAGLIPSLSVDDRINLSRSSAGQEILSNSSCYAGLISQRVLIFPVIKGGLELRSAANIVGFVGARVISASWNSQGEIEILGIRLCRSIAYGQPGKLPESGRLGKNIQALATQAPCLLSPADLPQSTDLLSDSHKRITKRSTKDRPSLLPQPAGRMGTYAPTGDDSGTQSIAKAQNKAADGAQSAGAFIIGITIACLLTHCLYQEWSRASKYSFAAVCDFFGTMAALRKRLVAMRKRKETITNDRQGTNSDLLSKIRADEGFWDKIRHSRLVAKHRLRCLGYAPSPYLIKLLSQFSSTAQLSHLATREVLEVMLIDDGAALSPLQPAACRQEAKVLPSPLSKDYNCDSTSGRYLSQNTYWTD